MPAPKTLGKYEIRREIGRGSMGVVYEGFDPLIERRVAVKVVRNDELDSAQAPELLARLKREAQAAGRLNHPGIVAIYDYGEDSTLHGGQVAYIAMELVDGGDLKSLLDTGRRFTIPEVARWMAGILGALQHAHERGVTHRDIKPGNVMQMPGGQIKIADFGIARLENSELTRTGTVVGTPQYMAPEQLLGLTVDGRADLFACGVILYQLLTGTKPFSGSYATVVQKVLNEEPPPPTTVNQALAPAWDAVVRKAMAKKPHDRFPSAAEFAAAVARAAAGDADEATLVRPPPAAVALPGQRIRPWPVAAIAAGATVGVAVLIGLFVARPPDRSPQVAGRAASAVDAAPVASAPAPVAVAAMASPVVPALPPVPVPAPVPAPTVAAKASRPAESIRTSEAAASAAAPAVKSAKPVARDPAPTVAVTPPRLEARPPGPPPAPSPTTPQPAFANEWAARLAAVEGARARLTLPAALALLLDIRREEDRQKIQTVDGLIRQQGPHTAVALGVVNGHLAFGWRAGASVEQAREAALARCREQRAMACSLVMVDEELRRPAFLEVAAGLGVQHVSEVRAAVLRGMDRAATALISASIPAQPREAPALPAPGVPAVAPPPVRPPEAAAATATVPPAPAREWAEAQAALRAATGGQLTLAKAFTILLNARAGHEIEVFERFETAVRRLQWKSALALGEKNGYVQWGSRSRDQNAIWAAENAINACNRVSSAPCVVVMADGKFNESGFLEFASRLGARPQPAVRDGLVRAMQKRLDAGGP